MTPERLERLRKTALTRQTDLTVVLENVHDPHNVSAVLRSCDSVGIYQIYLLYTDERIQLKKDEILSLGHKSSAGARRWVDVWYFDEVEACFADLKQRYEHIWGTHLGAASQNLYELDLCASTALVFGNERDGLSPAALSQCTGNFIIPQHGMVQSLNISVACAVSLFEAMRQRQAAGRYDLQEESAAHQQILETYKHRHNNRLGNQHVKRR